MVKLSIYYLGVEIIHMNTIFLLLIELLKQLLRVLIITPTQSHLRLLVQYTNCESPDDIKEL